MMELFQKNMSVQDQLKKNAAIAAADYLKEHFPKGSVIGVGTGSTVNFFIDALAQHKNDWSGAVSSSQASTERLQQYGVPVLPLNEVEDLPVYVDGADEIAPQGFMIKGGGGALTREKIIASVARQFVCIADIHKCVNTLGAFPVPIEVIPMARSAVSRWLSKYFPGGTITLRRQANGAIYLTDNQCEILDVSGLQLHDPLTIESEINQLAGVVSVGVFARRKADVLLLAQTAQSVRKFLFN